MSKVKEKLVFKAPKTRKPVATKANSIHKSKKDYKRLKIRNNCLRKELSAIEN
jgi:hypothetical protein